MKLLFFGTPEFAVPSLLSLIESQHQVSAVVTQPDRPKGRGRQTLSSPVKDMAVSRGIQVSQPNSLSDSRFLHWIFELGSPLAVVVAYGRLFPKVLLKQFSMGAINLHASLLPEYRGAAPIPWAILQGESKTGVTVFLLDEQLDHGPILTQMACDINPEDTTLTLSQRLSRIGSDTLLKTIDLLEKKAIEPKPQDDSKASFAPRLTKQEGIIDWKLSCLEIHNRVRALQPWPGATTWPKRLASASQESRPRSLKLLWTHPDPKRQEPKAHPGTIVLADPQKGLWIQTGKGQLRIDRLQEEGGKPMETKDFLRGHLLPPGTRFISLIE